MKTTTRACMLCRQGATVTDWEPLGAWLTVEGCSCGGYLVSTPLWDGHLAALSDMECKAATVCVQAVRAVGREAWLTMIDGQFLAVMTDPPR